MQQEPELPLEMNQVFSNLFSPEHLFFFTTGLFKALNGQLFWNISFCHIGDVNIIVILLWYILLCNAIELYLQYIVYF